MRVIWVICIILHTSTFGGFHSHGGTTKWMVYKGTSQSNGWFRGTSISGNLHFMTFFDSSGFGHFYTYLYHCTFVAILMLWYHWYPQKDSWIFTLKWYLQCFFFLTWFCLLAKHRWISLLPWRVVILSSFLQVGEDQFPSGVSSVIVASPQPFASETTGRFGNEKRINGLPQIPRSHCFLFSRFSSGEFRIQSSSGRKKSTNCRWTQMAVIRRRELGHPFRAVVNYGLIWLLL